MAEHPRVRGENHGWKPPTTGMAGTSPRARGKQRCHRRKKAVSRNIPACAGKTLLISIILYFFSEHPRVRGENL